MPPDPPRGWRARRSFVDRLGKLPSKEQQLSRLKQFILSSHAAMFVLHTQYGPCGIPQTPMVRRQNNLLSTLSKKTINMLTCFVWKKKRKSLTQINMNRQVVIKVGLLCLSFDHYNYCYLPSFFGTLARNDLCFCNTGT